MLDTPVLSGLACRCCCAWGCSRRRRAPRSCTPTATRATASSGASSAQWASSSWAQASRKRVSRSGARKFGLCWRRRLRLRVRTEASSPYGPALPTVITGPLVQVGHLPLAELPEAHASFAPVEGEKPCASRALAPIIVIPPGASFIHGLHTLMEHRELEHMAWNYLGGLAGGGRGLTGMGGG